MPGLAVEEFVGFVVRAAEDEVGGKCTVLGDGDCTTYNQPRLPRTSYEGDRQQPTMPDSRIGRYLEDLEGVGGEAEDDPGVGLDERMHCEAPRGGNWAALIAFEW